LIHIDAYRLEKGKDLGPLGFDEAMKDEGSLVVLEWPEMVADALPKADKAITLRVLEDGSRNITYV
jgi:tRNA A37 threonylcarbamoyladenosine biosynthesis protein TsaE